MPVGTARLTSTAGAANPAWSPDGMRIAFLREVDDENGVFLTPALGGGERQGHDPTLTWFRASLRADGGRYLVIVARQTLQDPDALFLFSTDRVSSLAVDRSESHPLSGPPVLSNMSARVHGPRGESDWGSALECIGLAVGSIPLRLTSPRLAGKESDWSSLKAAAWCRILAVCGDDSRASPAPRRTGSDARSRATRTDAAPCHCQRGR